MHSTTAEVSRAEPYYPESDGKPMAESTLQLDWIVKIVGNLKYLVLGWDNVFAAGNQFWYPVQRQEEIVQAPDAYVVFGRPKGERGSWKQWEEDNVPLTVVFEVLSPSNSTTEMAKKLDWYEEHGVEEYYVYDPPINHLIVYRRRGSTLVGITPVQDYRSPRLGIRFDLSGPEMVIYYPDGSPFLPFEQLRVLFDKAQQRADDALQDADKARQRADQAEQRADDALQDADKARQRADQAEQRADDALQDADKARQDADKARQQLDEVAQRFARVNELTRKLLAGQASDEEKQELARLTTLQP